jgi:hypothetical protein
VVFLKNRPSYEPCIHVLRFFIDNDLLVASGKYVWLSKSGTGNPNRFIGMRTDNIFHWVHQLLLLSWCTRSTFLSPSFALFGISKLFRHSPQRRWSSCGMIPHWLKTRLLEKLRHPSRLFHHRDDWKVLHHLAGREAIFFSCVATLLGPLWLLKGESWRWW